MLTQPPPQHASPAPHARLHAPQWLLWSSGRDRTRHNRTFPAGKARNCRNGRHCSWGRCTRHRSRALTSCPRRGRRCRILRSCANPTASQHNAHHNRRCHSIEGRPRHRRRNASGRSAHRRDFGPALGPRGAAALTAEARQVAVTRRLAPAVRDALIAAARLALRAAATLHCLTASVLDGAACVLTGLPI